MSKNLFKISLSLLFLLIILSLFIGRYPLPKNPTHFLNNDLFINLILMVRLPRIIFGILVGAGLSVSGLIMQNIFRNPLADPGLLGINQAAGFGAAAGILFFSNSFYVIQAFAFIFGTSSLIIALFLSKKIKNDDRLSLVLSGISVSALFSAGLGLMKYIADPLNELPSIVFWLLGGISSTNWNQLLRILPIILGCSVILVFYRWRINIYSMDKEVLFSMGIKNNWELYFILGISVLLTTAVISLSGIVGWVGLIIPNIVRSMVGQDTKKSLPLSIVFGGIFVLLSDNFARSILPGEIPLGVVTAFFGAIIFISLLVFKKNII